MKKLLLILALSLFLFDVSAQTKTAYCDVYARGGGKHMRITIMYNNTPYEMYPNGNRSNLGNVLNVLASDGWVLDRDIVIPRHPFHSTFTRHKLHLIMKKEYQEGEKPFSLFEPLQMLVCDELSVNTSESKDEAVGNTIDTAEVINLSEFIVSKCSAEGTWYDAIKYCKSLGKGWTLPNSEQVEYIIENSDIKFSSCWTNVDVNEKKAKAYNRAYSVVSEPKYSDNISIIAVKVVDKEVE
jgi:hypothetical protein